MSGIRSSTELIRLLAKRTQCMLVKAASSCKSSIVKRRCRHHLLNPFANRPVKSRMGLEVAQKLAKDWIQCANPKKAGAEGTSLKYTFRQTAVAELISRVAAMGHCHPESLEKSRSTEESGSA